MGSNLAQTFPDVCPDKLDDLPVADRDIPDFLLDFPRIQRKAAAVATMPVEEIHPRVPGDQADQRPRDIPKRLPVDVAEPEGDLQVRPRPFLGPDLEPPAGPLAASASMGSPRPTLRTFLVV